MRQQQSKRGSSICRYDTFSALHDEVSEGGVFHVGMVHVQKKMAAAKSAIKANKTKEEGQQQQLSTATEETKKLEDMQHDLQGEVSWPHQQC